MLFYWIITGIRWLVRFFTPLSAIDVARIDINAPCPCCGHRSGKLKCALGPLPPGVAAGARDAGMSVPQAVLCEHTCNVCGARWAEKPVAKVDSVKVQPTEVSK